jgi:arylsulfate sulfotransferase
MIIAVLALQGCGARTATSSAPSLAQDLGDHTYAKVSQLEIASIDPGVSPFIARLTISGNNLALLTMVQYTVQPKAGSISKAVNVTYSGSALAARGYLAPADSLLKLPVVGLYASYTNRVALRFQFRDGSTVALTTSIATADYTDPSGIYSHPTVLTQRAAGSNLGFDFFFMKSVLGSPVVLDTDGEIRWVAPLNQSSLSSTFMNGVFLIGNAEGATVTHLSLDGTMSQGPIASSTYTSFNHNIDTGKTGFLAEFNADENGVQNIMATIAEMTDTGSFLNSWDLGTIIGAYMTSHGDDASAFVRPGVDWFHSNSAIYDPSDDSLIVSSRENFVIKLDYLTGDIIWILGDPTKYWYTFPSLRAKALTLAGGGIYPIGQHALSINSDGSLMLFNDGANSFYQPAGAPAGVNRSYSAVSAYTIDLATMTATNIWNFDHGQTIYSEVCGSAYEVSDQSILVDYATADSLTHARLIGLDSNHNVVFDFEYPTTQCNTSWNAVPIPFDNLQLD